jgi:hypothetical protein
LESAIYLKRFAKKVIPLRIEQIKLLTFYFCLKVGWGGLKGFIGLQAFSLNLFNQLIHPNPRSDIPVKNPDG